MKEKKPASELLPIPDSMDVEERSGSLRIQWRWSRMKGAIALAAALVMTSVSIGIFVFGTAGDGSSSVWMGAVAVVLLLLGLFLLYGSLGYLLNHTLIRADAREIAVSHQPVPWLGNLTLNATDVRQVYCQEHVHTIEDDDEFDPETIVLGDEEDNTATSYSVSAVLKSGRKRQLVSGLDERDEARFIERRIEEFLGIADRRVAGEIS